MSAPVLSRRTLLGATAACVVARRAYAALGNNFTDAMKLGCAMGK